MEVSEDQQQRTDLGALRWWARAPSCSCGADNDGKSCREALRLPQRLSIQEKEPVEALLPTHLLPVF